MIQRKPSPADSSGAAAGSLCLRIVGSERDSQEILLSSPKCTIGSAEGSTLRLRAVGIRPLECLIIRGKNGTMLRSHARGARLNGRQVEAALLRVGDRLSVGPIELEVVALDVESSREVRAALVPCESISDAAQPCCTGQ
jgi:hypothetical protein